MSKTVLITGGEGFVGSHLVKRHVQAGNRVISLDNRFIGTIARWTTMNTYRSGPVAEVETLPVLPGVEYRVGHTRDIDKLVPEKPDLIYHLGEYSRVEKSLSEPALVWDLNTAGTFAVVEYWRRHGCKLIYAGSSTKFGDGGLGRVQSPYAWTKASNTELVQNYARWFGLRFAITYFYNVYGPGERAGAYGTVVEIFRQQVEQKKPLTVVSPGTQRRNFTYVDDIVEGLMLVGERGEGDEFGLGAEESYSVMEVAKMFWEREIVMLPERPGNRMDAILDTSRSRAIGWKPAFTLRLYIDRLMQRYVA